MAAGRKLGNLAADKTVFFCCDIQEKFRPAIAYFSDIVTCAGRLVQAAKILNIPLIATEQYPKGLGNTVPELDVSHAAGVFPKTKFSMVISEVEEKLKTLCGGDVQHIVLFGIEAHVCVQQTVIDLLERNYDVHVVADACSSRNMMDRVFAYQFGTYPVKNGIEQETTPFEANGLLLIRSRPGQRICQRCAKLRFQHSGAIVTTSEAVLLQLIGDKDHPKFKEIQGLIRDKAPDSGLLNKL